MLTRVACRSFSVRQSAIANPVSRAPIPIPNPVTPHLDSSPTPINPHNYSRPRCYVILGGERWVMS